MRDACENGADIGYMTFPITVNGILVADRFFGGYTFYSYM